MSLLPVKNILPFKIILVNVCEKNMVYRFILYSELDLYNNKLNHTIQYTYWQNDSQIYYWLKKLSRAILISSTIKSLEEAKQFVLEHYNKNKDI